MEWIESSERGEWQGKWIHTVIPSAFSFSPEIIPNLPGNFVDPKQNDREIVEKGSTLKQTKEYLNIFISVFSY